MRRDPRDAGPSVSFRAFGCRLNQAEGAALRAAFEVAGFRCVGIREPADVCVVHGCTVTRAAEREGLRAVRALSHRSPRPLVVLSGCTAQASILDPADRAHIDLLVDQRHKWELPHLVAARLQRCPDGPLNAPELSGTGGSPALPRFRGVRAWLRVQDGCDFHCAYCIIPRARGNPHSRPFDEILSEAQRLVMAGNAELVITGANIACYRDGRRGLCELVGAIAKLEGLQRLRLGSIEPATVERELVDFMGEEPRLCRQLHLPLQSGDPAVLRSMGRRYTPEAFCETVALARRHVPDIGLGTDVITGLPGETSRAFEHTRTLIEKLRFSNLHVFPYSERPATRAATLPEQVPVALRRARAAALIELGQQLRRDYAAGFTGRRVRVLPERVRDGRTIGWTDTYLRAVFEERPQPPVGCTCEAAVLRVDGETLYCGTASRGRV